MTTLDRSELPSVRAPRIVTSTRLGSTRYSLNERELDVLYLVLQGQYEKQIARTLGVSVLEIRERLGSVQTKMGARSTTEAAVKAIRERLLD